MNICDKKIPTHIVAESEHLDKALLSNLYSEKWKILEPKFVINLIQTNTVIDFSDEFQSIFTKSFYGLTRQNFWIIAQALKFKPISVLSKQFSVNMANKRMLKGQMRFPFIGILSENDIPYRNPLLSDETGEILLTKSNKKCVNSQLDMDSCFSHYFVKKNSLEITNSELIKKILNPYEEKFFFSIFIAGDIESIDLVKDLIDSGNRFCIIENSGGLAKLLFKLKKKNKLWKNSYLQELKNFFIFQEDIPNERQLNFRYILEKLNFSHFVTLKTEKDLNDCIFNSIEITEKNLDSLQTAINFRKYESIKEHIHWMSIDELCIDNHNKEDSLFNITVERCLLDDRQLLDIILQSDIDKSDFFSIKLLRFLYMKLINEEKLYFIKNVKKKFERIDKDFFDKTFDEQIAYVSNRLFFCVLDEAIQSHLFFFWVERLNFFNFKLKEKNGDIIHLFFFWAILSGNIEIAECVLQSVSDPIQFSLVGYFLSKKHAGCLRRRNKLNEAARLFKFSTTLESYAVKILQTIYNMKGDLNHAILNNQESSIFHISNFELARKVRALNFLNTQEFKSNLNQLWKGKLPENTPNKKIFICILIPLYMFYVCYNENIKTKSFSEEPVESYIDENSNVQYKTKIPDTPNLNFLQKLFAFYNAPISKYWIHLVRVFFL